MRPGGTLRRSGAVPTVSATFRVGLFADDVTSPGMTENTPVVGRWAEGVVLANGLNYRFGMYDPEGTLRYRVDRNIAPRRLTAAEIETHLGRLAGTPIGNTPARLARARERLEARPTRWFSHTGAPRSDGLGRLWVVVNYGDSTAADVTIASPAASMMRLRRASEAPTSRR